MARDIHGMRIWLTAIVSLSFSACTGVVGFDHGEPAGGAGGTDTNGGGELGSGGTGGAGNGNGGGAGSDSGSAGSGGDSGSGASGGGSGSGASGGDSGSGGDGGGGVEPRDPLPCFADAGEPAAGAISLELSPSRVSGVAPLAVFFETTGTTATATAKPFHELAYCWDFDDPEAGVFGPSGLSKNMARGPNVGHVFESPGTYTVAVSARDSVGRVTTRV